MLKKMSITQTQVIKQILTDQASLLDNKPFQTAMAFKKLSSLEANIVETIDEKCHDDSIDSIFKTWLANCYSRMIQVEKYCFQTDYAVFYRIIEEQYVAYELHSFVLHMSQIQTKEKFIEILDGIIKGKREYLDWQFICTNTITDSDYPPKINQLIEKMDQNPNFERGTISDMNPIAKCFLSANCCFIGHEHGRNTFAYNFSSDPEVGVFWKGYNAGYTFLSHAISECFIHVFKFEDEVVIEQFVQAIKNMYKTFLLESVPKYKQNDEVDSDEELDVSDFEGHMVQICIPISVLDKYAYPAVPYGSKVDVFEIKTEKGPKVKGEISTKNDRYNTLKHIPNTDILREVSFKELLQSKDVNKVQARIMAHPDMYLQDKAFCKIYHGLENFDYIRFRHKMILLLYPFLESIIE